jgi:D-alanine--D-alanine ligase
MAMKLKKPHIAVFFGGDAGSRDLSEETGLWLCYFLPRGRYHVTPVQVTEQGDWQVPLGSLPERGPIKQIMTNLFQAVKPEPPARGLERLLRRPVRALVTVLRGRGGDDGALHGLAATLGIPVVGSPLAACQRTSDKHACGLSLSDIVVPPQMRRYPSTADVATIIEDAREALVPPLFVKPARQEGSVGVSEATSVDELGGALAAASEPRSTGRAAAHRQGDILVQQRTPGTEVCITLFDDEWDSLHALPATVVAPKAARYFDHLAKRRAGRVALHTERHDDPLVHEAEAIARDAYREIGCRGLVSFDLVTGDEALELLDVNTVPTLTDHTPLMQQLKVARVHPGILFDRLIQRGLAEGL